MFVVFFPRAAEGRFCPIPLKKSVFE